MDIVRVERGWQGHFICRCLYHRNTLLFANDSDKRYVISTVGNMRDMYGKTDTIGHDRYYESYVFEAKLDGDYWEADVVKQIWMRDDVKWAISSEEYVNSKDYVENIADGMHEHMVAAVEMQIRKGEL